MSNYSPTMPWPNSLPAYSPAALGDLDMGRLIRRRRIGIFFFWVLFFLSVNNLNAVALMALGTQRIFSYPMLIACIVVLLSFQVALLRDMGTSGLMFFIFFATYFAISLPIGIQNFSIDFYVRAHWIRMHLTSLIIMAACAQGARHVTLAWSKQRLLHWVYIVTLVQVVMIYVGMAFPGVLYAKTGLLTEGRYTGFFRNPNEAGMASCACVAVGFAYLTVAKHKAWVVAGLLAGAFGTVLTFSRSAFVTLFALIMLQIFISPIIKRKSILVVVMLAMGFVSWFATVGVFSLIDVNATQTRRLASIKRIITLQADEEDTGERFEGMRLALGHWLDSPIVGNGFTTMQVLEETGLGPHNHFLLVLGEGGILALGTMLLFIAVYLYTAWVCKDKAARALGLGIGFVFGCSCMVNHTVLTNRSIIALIGVSMGLFSAVAYRTRLLERMAHAARMAYPSSAPPQPAPPSYGAPLPPPAAGQGYVPPTPHTT